MNQEKQEQHEQGAKRELLPLGSVVILKGSVKKLLIVSRGSIVESAFFDYGAFLYPEGMIDTNIAYFNHDDVLKVVHEGYSDQDNELVLEILNDAYVEFQQCDTGITTTGAGAVVAGAPVAGLPVPVAAGDEDLFASFRDGVDDDE